MAGPLSQMPMNVHPVPKADNTVAEKFIEQIDGETSFDQIAKAQSSMPQVVERITNLENCVWALAEQLTRFDPRNPQIERAKLLLKNRLEILDSSDVVREEKGSPGSFSCLLREANSATANTDLKGGKATEESEDGAQNGRPRKAVPTKIDGDHDKN